MIFASNLKCNHTRASFKDYALDLNLAIEELKLRGFDDEVFVFPPSIAFLNEFELKFNQGAQNFYPCQNGAYTGEIGLEHLQEFNINSVLIGHSERRVFENDEFIRLKFEFAKKHNFKIIFCIGESLETKNSGKTKDFLSSQLTNLDLTYENLILAYEPIYSIGSGVSADKNDIQSVFEFLANLSEAPLLYGGSVSENNIKEILNTKNCSGVLIGSAALKIENFVKMIKLSKSYN